MGFDSAGPRRRIPYSVSTPQTLGIATRRPYRRAGAPRPHRSDGPATVPWRTALLQVLAGGHPLDGPPAHGVLVRGDEGAHVDDALALLPGDLGPVVRVGGVRQVLVLLVLLDDGGDQVVGADALRPPGDEPLDCQLLGPAHDVLDHGAGREVLEVHDLLVTVLIGDFEEAVVVVGAVHRLDGLLDHCGDALVTIAAAEGVDLVLVKGQIGREVTRVDLRGRGFVGALDLDL